MTITREQLELAALAAGHKVYGWCVLCDDRIAYADIGPEESVAWRPHLDDGDSRRLQVSMAATLSVCCDGRNIAEAWCLRPGPMITTAVPHDGTTSDMALAAREAVVLCAAAVGERMKEAK